LNDSLHPLPRAGESSNAGSSTPASSSDSFDSYNGDDARCFIREWKVTQDHYSEATRENGQLKIHLGVSQAALHAIEEEANAVQARLAESDTRVAGEMNFLECLYFYFHCLYIDSSSISVIASPDGAVGVSSTGSECGRGCRQCSGPPHQRPPP
jgi:hypothetical protein